MKVLLEHILQSFRGMEVYYYYIIDMFWMPMVSLTHPTVFKCLNHLEFPLNFCWFPEDSLCIVSPADHEALQWNALLVYNAVLL